MPLTEKLDWYLGFLNLLWIIGLIDKQKIIEKIHAVELENG